MDFIDDEEFYGHMPGYMAHLIGDNKYSYCRSSELHLCPVEDRPLFEKISSREATVLQKAIVKHLWGNEKWDETRIRKDLDNHGKWWKIS